MSGKVDLHLKPETIAALDEHGRKIGAKTGDYDAILEDLFKNVRKDVWAGNDIESLKMKASELKGTVNLHYIQCSCGETWELANGPRQRRVFLDKHKDHIVKRFQVTTTVS